MNVLIIVDEIVAGGGAACDGVVCEHRERHVAVDRGSHTTCGTRAADNLNKIGESCGGSVGAGGGRAPLIRKMLRTSVRESGRRSWRELVKK